MTIQNESGPTPLSVDEQHRIADEVKAAKRQAADAALANERNVFDRSTSLGYYNSPSIGKENYAVLEGIFRRAVTSAESDLASIAEAEALLGGPGEGTVTHCVVGGVLLSPDPRDNPGLEPHFVVSTGESRFNDLTKITADMADYWTSQGGDMVIVKSNTEGGYQVMFLYENDADGNPELVAWVAESSKPDNAIYVQKFEESVATSEQEAISIVQQTKRETRESGAVRIFHKKSGETTDDDIKRIKEILRMAPDDYYQLWSEEVNKL